MIRLLLAAPEFKVGLMVLVVSGMIGTMALKVSQDPSYMGSSKEAWFNIEDASGLVKNSKVKMAGIDVGIIKEIKLENGQARVLMTVKGETPLTKSARIEIRPNGILGDKHVEIISGDPRDPPLRDGEQILVVDDRASVDRLIGEVSKITKSLSSVAENIKSATEGDTDKPLGRIVSNIEQLTGDLAEFTKERKVQLGEIVENVHSMTGTLDDLVSDESPEGLKASFKKALASIRRIDKTLTNVEQITDKINRGEGTIGRLINDDSTIEQINSAVDSINGYLETSNKIQTAVDFHGDFLANNGSAKGYLSLLVQPGLDRYYELGIVNDPKGVSERTLTTSSVNGGTDTVLAEKKVYRDKFSFTALFAKNFYDFTLKGGMIENTGGAALDYYMWRRRLRLSLEVFDFSKLHIRSYARYSLFRGIYLAAGGDDLASTQGNQSAYFGAGVFMTNDDLKLLLTKSPF